MFCNTPTWAPHHLLTANLQFLWGSQTFQNWIWSISLPVACRVNFMIINLCKLKGGPHSKGSCSALIGAAEWVGAEVETPLQQWDPKDFINTETPVCCKWCKTLHSACIFFFKCCWKWVSGSCKRHPGNKRPEWKVPQKPRKSLRCSRNGVGLSPCKTQAGRTDKKGPVSASLP